MVNRWTWIRILYFHFVHWWETIHKEKVEIPLRSYCYFCVFIKTYERMITILENQKRWIIMSSEWIFCITKSSINPLSNCFSNFRFHYWWKCIFKLVTFGGFNGNRYYILIEILFTIDCRGWGKNIYPMLNLYIFKIKPVNYIAAYPNPSKD